MAALSASESPRTDGRGGSPARASAKTLLGAAARYQEALRDCVNAGGERALVAAYELGRWAIDAGVGVLDLVAAHHEALGPLLAGAREPARTAVLAGAALSEALAPFEVARRGVKEENELLRHMNDRLEEETRRIANSLHGEAGQLLASVHIALAELERELPAAARQRIHAVRAVLDGVEAGLRRLSHELRPTLLDDLGLMPAIRFHAEGIEQRTQLRVSVGGSTQGRHPPAVEIGLYRVVQEALQNVLRHARAAQATVFFRRDPAGLHCMVADDGIGFEPAALVGKVERGMGLMGIRDRIAGLGGTLELRGGGEGRGTVLVTFIPLQRTGARDAT